MNPLLVLQFRGWCLIRLPTDPDPMDEPRGVSGYTFALAGEPDLDRVIYLQPAEGLPVRSHSPQIGVNVYRAARVDDLGAHELPGLLNARVELLDGPKLESRNWILTPAGFEPIVPFHLRITTDELVIHRDAPLDPQNPDLPVWKVDSARLIAQGASGMQLDPLTIGQATGMWDALHAAQLRLADLEKDLAELEKDPANATETAALKTRIEQLKIGIQNPFDRRIMARYGIERFNFPMRGLNTEIRGDEETILSGLLEERQPWPISFWLGAWDPDLMCAYMEGALRIPYVMS